MRVARWCGTTVAAKQLHALDDSRGRPAAGAAEGGATAAPILSEEGLRALVAEFAALSGLRHPNLVLFLGVTFDPASGRPDVVLTELLPHSLYDLLETQRVRLGPHEVLGLAADVANALAYLHSRTPAVVHWAISARNVLLDRQVGREGG